MEACFIFFVILISLTLNFKIFISGSAIHVGVNKAKIFQTTPLGEHNGTEGAAQKSAAYKSPMGSRMIMMSRGKKSGKMGSIASGHSTSVMTTGIKMSQPQGHGVQVDPKDLILGAKGLALTGVLIGQYLGQNGGIGGILGRGGFGLGGGGFNGGIPREGIIPNRYPENYGPGGNYPEPRRFYSERNPDRYYPEGRNLDRFYPDPRYYPELRRNPDRFHPRPIDTDKYDRDTLDPDNSDSVTSHEIKIESNDTCLLDDCI